jgi:chromosomal replication initiation ATPase DnaA
MVPDRQQFMLPLPHDPSYDAADFITAASNRGAQAWLERTRDWPDRRLALWGQAGCGKTHLLHIWAQRTGAVILAGSALHEPPAARGALAVDDADGVAPDTVLLHLLNSARDNGVPVLLTSRTAPARWETALPDLRSRLRAITAVEIAEPDDALLRALLPRLLADRQLVMSDSVQDWLLRRLPRSPAALRDAVVRLDRASMAAGTAITRSFIARLLPGVSACQDDEDCITNRVSSSQPAGLL